MNATTMLKAGVDVRVARPSDQHALLALHQVGFGSRWQPADWLHRYVDNPLHRGAAVGAFLPDGSCAAAFCGVVLPCRIDGAERFVCRAGDVVVHPDLRRSAAGPKLLLKVCSQFVQHLAGTVDAIFGFPEPGLSRTLVRHCRYEVMSDVTWLCRPVLGCAAPPDDRQVDGLDASDDELAAFLHAHGSRRPTGLTRSIAYLRWRYRRDPRGRYTMLAARDADGAIRGLAVARPQQQHPGALMINELLLDPDDDRTLHAVTAKLAEVATGHGCDTIATSFPVCSPEFARLQAAQFTVCPSPYQFVYRPYSTAMSRRFLFENWFLTPGDIDFT